MADNHDELNGLGETESLPPELRALHGRMLADGAAWRAGRPSTERLAHSVSALLNGISTPAPRRPAVETARVPAISAPASRYHPMPGAGRLSALGAMLAAALVVTLMGALLHNLAARRSTNQLGAHQPTATAAATPAGQWENALVLANQPAEPIIASSDSRVAYEAGQPPTGSGQPMVLRRTDDAGATWHDLPVPRIANTEA